MNRLLTIILFSVLALTSCIQNDLPKPVVELFIASLDVEGVSGDIVLDRSTYTATIPLAEETNIEAVQFKSISYGSDVITNVNFTADNDKIVVSKDLNNAIVNMTNTEYIYLTYFQTYEWKIVATQHINRIWNVDGQIGATEWDVEGHRAIVKRRQDYPLNNVETTDIRYGSCTTRNTQMGLGKFSLPQYFMTWYPTCGFSDADSLTLLNEFIKADCTEDMLFYVWGHGYELDIFNTWDKFETMIKTIAEAAEKDDSIVLVTNAEFYQLFKDEIPSWKE